MVVKCPGLHGTGPKGDIEHSSPQAPVQNRKASESKTA